jgi:hypothetical protein
MPYQFPIPAVPMLQESLDIAMYYLEHTRQAYPFSETERFCAEVIFQEWYAGRRHRLWLANRAIVALEQARKEARWERRERPRPGFGHQRLTAAELRRLAQDWISV